MIRMSEPMREILDVSEEKDSKLAEELSDISRKNQAVLLALIAPYVGRKVSPTKTISAHMGLSEEFGVETVIDDIKGKTNVKKLMLLINSPGGLIRSSYKVARALRNSFKEIIVFIPHIAASGGTLVALTGNEIVMGMMSQFTPLSPHGEDEKGRSVSALSVIEAFEYVTEFFKRVAVEDAPYTYRVLAEKYDAVDIHDALAIMSLMNDYICEILEGSGYKKDKCKVIAKTLIRDFKNHAEVINFDKAKALLSEKKVVPHTKYPNEWKKLREWLGKYMLQSADKHIIRYVIAQDLEKKKKSSLENEASIKSEG